MAVSVRAMIIREKLSSARGSRKRSEERLFADAICLKARVTPACSRSTTLLLNSFCFPEQTCGKRERE